MLALSLEQCLTHPPNIAGKMLVGALSDGLLNHFVGKGLIYLHACTLVFSAWCPANTVVSITRAYT